ncbi:MAG: nucleoside deaminase [Bdellovibrio sp.]|nr:nucleoside deaminase [Bdellovibrio sp.]
MNNQINARDQKDLDFMEMAIDLAKTSEQKGEVPIGALIVDEAGKVIAKATNLRETNLTVLGHAELVAIHRACKKLKSWRLTNCTLYVTLEPCHMCAGALVQSRIKRVVFGAFDPKGGALGTLNNLAEDKRLNHQFEAKGGIKQEECSHLLKTFFKKKRASKKAL